MYLVFKRVPGESTATDGVYVPCIYTHANVPRTATDGVYVPCIYTHANVPLVEFMYLAFTRVPGESYRRRLSYLLLYLCYVFRSLINSLVC